MNVNGNRFYKELNCSCFISIHGITKKPTTHHLFPECIYFPLDYFFSMIQMMMVPTADEDE